MAFRKIENAEMFEVTSETTTKELNKFMSEKSCFIHRLPTKDGSSKMLLGCVKDR